MRRRTKDISLFNISFLDVITGALGAVIILFITVPKQKTLSENKEQTPQTKECTYEQNEILECKKELKEKSASIEEKNIKINRLQKEKEELKAENEKFKSKNKIVSEIKEENKTKDGKKQVGFNFKGKNIVFLIDISGSMIGDKIGEVKAGLKMLIASMGKEYKIDVVYFPHSRNRAYYPLWGLIQNLRTPEIKNEVYRFIRDLRPRGGTPTKSALDYVLGNYTDITDIVLLSDGVPSDAGKDEILNLIRQRNTNNIQINTIGVGLNNYNPKSKLYEILEAISSETKGFNYGF